MDVRATRSTRWWIRLNVCTWLGWVSRPGSPESAYRCLVYAAVLVREPGRSLCQDVTLLSNLAQLTTQQRQLLSLSRCQRRIGSPTAELIRIGLANPCVDAGVVATKLFGKRTWPAPSFDQLNHLLTKFRRVPRFSMTHLYPL